MKKRLLIIVLLAGVLSAQSAFALFTFSVSWKSGTPVFQGNTQTIDCFKAGNACTWTLTISLREVPDLGTTVTGDGVLNQDAKPGTNYILQKGISYRFVIDGKVRYANVLPQTLTYSERNAVDVLVNVTTMPLY